MSEYVKNLLEKGKKSEKLDFLIKYLLNEQNFCQRINPKIEIPLNLEDKWEFLRALTSMRLPGLPDNYYLTVQDNLYSQINEEKGITDFSSLKPVKKFPNIYLWKGDITSLKIDSIVNAANSGMTGCYNPGHKCIDNCIHAFSGVQLRSFCEDIMIKQGTPEPTGLAKITPAFNLPCKYVIHTVGPIVEKGILTEEHKKLLGNCYYNCLKICKENNVQSIAFCCISTGIFGFPKDKAAIIALNTVLEFFEKNKDTNLKVVFNVFLQDDYDIYKALLS